MNRDETAQDEIAEASVLLAEATEEAAEVLATTTEQSVRTMNRLTIILVVVGIIQIVVAIIALWRLQ